MGAVFVGGTQGAKSGLAFPGANRPSCTLPRFGGWSRPLRPTDVAIVPLLEPAPPTP